MEQEELKGTITKFLYPSVLFNDFEFAIFKVKTEDKREISCKGKTPIYMVGDSVIMNGTYVSSKNYKETFCFDVIKRDLSIPKTQENFLKFICGKKTAETVKTHFKTIEAVFDFFNNNIDDVVIDELTKINGIGIKKATKFLEKYQKNIFLEKIYDFLAEYGFSLEEALAIGKNLKNDAVEKIKENPYILSNLMRFSFERCDKIAIKMNFDLNSDKRYLCGICRAVGNELDNGHVYTNIEEIVNKSVELLTVSSLHIASREKVINNIQTLLKNNVLVMEDENIYFAKVFKEKELLKQFVLRVKAKPKFNYDFDVDEAIKKYEISKANELKISNYALGKEQKEAVKNTLLNQVSIITGGPGTGKTTVLDCVLTIFKDYVKIKPYDIALCSPTGKASKRMTEATKMPASTIHKLLEVDPATMDKKGQPEFVYNENNKLPHRLIVIDETSMLDFGLASSLIEAIKDNCRVVFVGDIDQLPPVSYGYTLRDLIDSKVPCVKLWEVKRQKGDSSIIPLSQMIRNDELELFKAKDFGFASLKDITQICDIYIRGLNELKKSFSNPLDEIVILTPQNKGDFGTRNLNEEIQKILFPNAKKIEHNKITFVEGGKVLQIRNNNEIGIVNGEIGYIEKIDFEEKILVIKFETSTQIYDAEMLDDLVLGYAMTIHKSQGSEWSFVIELCSCSSNMNTKSLVYTGVTRTKNKLIVLGDTKTFLECPKKLGSPRRSKIL